MRAKHEFSIPPKRHPFVTGCMVVVTFLSGLLAVPAQTGNYTYLASEQSITLNPGAYIITAYGAKGGGNSTTTPSIGGLGAEMKGVFTFTTVTTLTILVGGAGNGATRGGGGGGGSFVFNGNTPLVIAGGGGGGGEAGNIHGIQESGGNGSAGITGTGDSSGGGGSGGGGGSTESSGGGGGGGGGYNGSGSHGNSSPAFFPDGGSGGSSYLSGGGGGSGSELGGSGGYGGGGGGGAGGGGGGGYSGGYGGEGIDLALPAGGGGGGGSYISPVATAKLTQISGVASPDDSPNGEIIISVVPPPTLLAITLSGNEVILTWPTNAAGFTLQTATNFAPTAVWSAVSPAPVVINGNNTVTNPIVGGQVFYRLSL